MRRGGKDNDRWVLANVQDNLRRRLLLGDVFFGRRRRSNDGGRSHRHLLDLGLGLGELPDRVAAVGIDVGVKLALGRRRPMRVAVGILENGRQGDSKTTSGWRGGEGGRGDSG